MEVFDLSGVAAILNAPKSRVKNWTIGRPLKISPSLRAARGRGSRNLYSLEDVYLMALANRLSADGLSTRVIAQVLSQVRRDPNWETARHSRRWLEIGLAKGKLHVTLIAANAEKVVLRRGTGELGRYLLDLEGLVKEVQEGIVRLQVGWSRKGGK